MCNVLFIAVFVTDACFMLDRHLTAFDLDLVCDIQDCSCNPVLLWKTHGVVKVEFGSGTSIRVLAHTEHQANPGVKAHRPFWIQHGGPVDVKYAPSFKSCFSLSIQSTIFSADLKSRSPSFDSIPVMPLVL